MLLIITLIITFKYFMVSENKCLRVDGKVQLFPSLLSIQNGETALHELCVVN